MFNLAIPWRSGSLAVSLPHSAAWESSIPGPRTATTCGGCLRHNIVTHAVVTRSQGEEASTSQPKQQANNAASTRASNNGAKHSNVDNAARRVKRKGGAARFFSAVTFVQCGASADVIDAVSQLGITRPSHIQAAAYEAWASGAQHMVYGDQAGSGKTLAYLLPLLQQLRVSEQRAGARLTRPNAPRALIICPTEELAVQVGSVARALTQTVRVRTAIFTGNRIKSTQRQVLAEGVDVLIATPGRVAELLRLEAMTLQQCEAIVVDEVDVLLGDTGQFNDQVQPLMKAAARNTRFVFVTATLPEPFYATLTQLFPSVVPVIGPGLHRTSAGLKEQLVDCSGGEDISEESGFRRKAVGLLAVLQQQRAHRTIVFCNKIESCRKVENFLARHDKRSEQFTVLPYHAAIADATRQSNLKRFLQPPGDDDKPLILVCTDRASRGLDSAFVEHVVLFDFPRDPSEYVRRVGRTARGAQGEGVVSVLVLGRQAKLARDIIGRNQKGLPLHKVPEHQILTGLTRVSKASRQRP